MMRCHIVMYRSKYLLDIPSRFSLLVPPEFTVFVDTMHYRIHRLIPANPQKLGLIYTWHYPNPNPNPNLNHEEMLRKDLLCATIATTTITKP